MPELIGYAPFPPLYDHAVKRPSGSYGPCDSEDINSVVYTPAINSLYLTELHGSPYAEACKFRDSCSSYSTKIDRHRIINLLRLGLSNASRFYNINPRLYM